MPRVRRATSWLGYFALFFVLLLAPYAWAFNAIGVRAWFRGLAADSMYYLAIANNWNTLGFPTFDWVEPSTGFHPLWMLLLVAPPEVDTGPVPSPGVRRPSRMHAVLVGGAYPRASRVELEARVEYEAYPPGGVLLPRSLRHYARAGDRTCSVRGSWDPVSGHPVERDGRDGVLPHAPFAGNLRSVRVFRVWFALPGIARREPPLSLAVDPPRSGRLGADRRLHFRWRHGPTATHLASANMPSTRRSSLALVCDAGRSCIVVLSRAYFLRLPAESVTGLVSGRASLERRARVGLYRSLVERGYTLFPMPEGDRAPGYRDPARDGQECTPVYKHEVSQLRFCRLGTGAAHLSPSEPPR